MTRRAGVRAALAAAAVALVAPLLTGCSARLDQVMGIAADGGGNLSVALTLDPAAQQAIDLQRQLDAGTFQQFLQVNGEKWFAPGSPAEVFRRETRPDGTVVLTSVHHLRAGTGDLADLQAALAAQRPLQPFLTATGRYWAAPSPGSGTTSTSTTGTAGGTTTVPATVTGAGEAQSGITGLPASVTLQSLLSADFTPARTDRNNRRVPATFSLASRGGVGEVLDTTCDAAANRYTKTRADKALDAGLRFTYTWAMPTTILGASESARLSADGATATWAMPFGRCDLMELSSAGADDGRFVNGLILGIALGFLLIVFAWRSLSRRRRGGGDSTPS